MESLRPEVEQTTQEVENETEPKYGANVVIRNFWGRHAQKRSGEVVVDGEISKSLISDKGAEDSVDFGKGIEASVDGAKIYTSTSQRAIETAESIVEGYQQSNPDVPIRKLEMRDQLTLDFPKEFMELYEARFIASRTELMQQMNLDPSKFKELSPDQQEEIAEKAEEPLLTEWLSGKGEFSRLMNPETSARIFAQLFDRHNDRMASKLYSGSQIDLFHVSHRGIMEPFLTSGVLVRTRDGKTMRTLDELGGPMAILEGWESKTETDDKGTSKISVLLRGEEYIVDRAALKNLAQRDKETENLEIDPSRTSDEKLIDLASAEKRQLSHLERKGYEEYIARLRDPEKSQSLAATAIEEAKKGKISAWSLSFFADSSPTLFSGIISELEKLDPDSSQKKMAEVEIILNKRFFKWMSIFEPENAPEDRTTNMAVFLVKRLLSKGNQKEARRTILLTAKKSPDLAEQVIESAKEVDPEFSKDKFQNKLRKEAQEEYSRRINFARKSHSQPEYLY